MLHFKKPSCLAPLVACALLLCASLAGAQALPKGVTQAAATDGITEYRLDNGLKVLLFPDASKPTALVNITYLVGSSHENYGESGMAHLLEHLLFKGTPKHANIPQEFNRRGMRINGTTGLDRTNYHEFFQAGDANLKWAIELEADRMVNSFIAKKDLDAEMTVVRNEFERSENSPFGVMQKRMQSIAYDWHSYGKSVLGNRSDIENVGIENLQAFYRTYYQPDNAVLLIAGKFDAAQTLRWVTAAFGPIARPARKLRQSWTVEPTQDGERSFSVRRKDDLQMIELGYKVPSALHADNVALGFASAILAMPNGRLHQQLVESGKAAEIFSGGQAGFAPGLLVLGAIVKKDAATEPARDGLIAVAEDFYKQPPTPQEMERVRRNYLNQNDQILNDHEKIGIALSETIALGDWRLLFVARDQMSRVTAAQVSAAAKRYFRRDNRTVGTLVPEDQPLRAEIPAAPGIAELMKDFKPNTHATVSEAFDPSSANVDARTRRSQVGGVQLALLPKKNRGETVSVAINLLWGDEKSLFGKQIVSGLTDEMLMRGNRLYTRQQLADEFSKLKITGGVLHFDTTREHVADALRLVAQVLKEPAFSAAEFEQLRTQVLVDAEASRSDPEALAKEALAVQFNRYPKGDYRAPLTTDETIAGVKAISLDELKAFHKNFYGASRAEIAIVGDFDEAAVRTVIGDTFGNWQSAAPYRRLSEQHVDIAPVTRLIDTPDKENGVYMARVNFALRDDDPDFAALVVANYLFGDAGTDSRLLQRIRQKDGLSYGGRSSLRVSSFDPVASFSIHAIAAPQNLLRVDAAVRQELARVLKDGFSAQEVAGAKSGILQQRMQERAQDAALAGGWTRNLYLDRTFAWGKAVEDRISALSVEQVNAALRKAIDPARISVVMAGDKARMNAADGAAPANRSAQR